MPRLGEQRPRATSTSRRRCGCPRVHGRREPRAAAGVRAAQPREPAPGAAARRPPPAEGILSMPRGRRPRAERRRGAARARPRQVLHDQRGGQELRHPPPDPAPLRARGAPEALAHRRQHPPLFRGRPAPAGGDPEPHPRPGREPGGRRDHPEHAPQDGADAGGDQRVPGPRQRGAAEERARRTGAGRQDQALVAPAPMANAADVARSRGRRQGARRRYNPSARRPCNRSAAVSSPRQHARDPQDRAQEAGPRAPRARPRRARAHAATASTPTSARSPSSSR